MATVIYLDTHVAAWLYAGQADLLSPRAAEAIERTDEIRISPIVALELEHLRETKQLAVGAKTVIAALQALIGLRTCDLPFAVVVASALLEDWTRDPFDRIIVAQAQAASLPLVTKDRNIRSQYKPSIW